MKEFQKKQKQIKRDHWIQKRRIIDCSEKEIDLENLGVEGGAEEAVERIEATNGTVVGGVV